MHVAVRSLEEAMGTRGVYLLCHAVKLYAERSPISASELKTGGPSDSESQVKVTPRGDSAEFTEWLHRVQVLK
jgi:hypothetical protein